MVIMTTISDRMQSRGIPTAIVFAISTVGWVILLVVEDNVHAKFVVFILLPIGIYV